MAAEAAARVELAISGMTFASCASRIERKLNRLEGVEASVNYGSEEATVSFDPATIALEQIVVAVEAAGYGAALRADARERDGARGVLGLRLVVAALLSLPLVLLAMIPPLQFGDSLRLRRFRSARAPESPSPPRALSLGHTQPRS